MPARFVIDSADIICKPLTHIINLSIQSGVFPCGMKNKKILQYTRKKQKLTIDRYQFLILSLK